MKNIFVTATGTDVGKTYVSALIVKKMRDLGYNCGYFKPAVSGMVDNENDCSYVMKTAEIKGKPEDYITYSFKPALSPHLASKIENRPIELDKIIEHYKRLSKEFDCILVEGAGGIVCPFSNTLLLPDVIKALGLDVIIVASAQLGTINSTVLTVEYAKNHEINVKGIILNNFDKNNLMHTDNKACIEKLTGVKVIATVAQGQTEIDDIREVFE